MRGQRSGHQQSSLLQGLASRRAVVRAGLGFGMSLPVVSVLSRGVAAQDASPVAGGSSELVLGGLFSLTGEWSTLGLASEAALDLAAQDINEELSATGSPVRVRVLIEDTRLEPDRALEMAQALADQGATIFIGPQSSSEVAAVKDYADANDLLMISQGSTASSLAIPGDNVFRVVPTDVPEVEALIQLMQQDGIEVVVPIWRDDDGNRSLHESMANLLPEHGGTVLEGIEHAVAIEDFSETLTALSEQVAQATSEHDAGSVAVFVATFDDVAPLFAGAAQDPTLSGVPWYGTNGSALIEALPANAEAAAFAVETGYVAPLLGLSESTRPRWQPVADRIEAETGQSPDAFGLAAYDAAWIAALAYLQTGESSDVEALKAALAYTANRYYGVTGPTELTEAGDRVTGDFDFWAIGDANGGYEWWRAASYSAVTGEVTREMAEADGAATPTG